MNYKQLTLEQRYQLSGLLKSGMTQIAVAQSLKVHPSTLSRELRRNRGGRGYRPKQAHSFALERRHHSAKAIKWTRQLEKRVVKYLRLEWSPDQISNHLKQQVGLLISHERIYQFIAQDKQESGTLYQHLRCGHKRRKKRYGSTDRRGIIKNRVGIEKRPKIVDKRNRIGDWEIDTIMGKNHQGAIVSLVERTSLFTLLAKVRYKRAQDVATQTIRLLSPYQSLVYSITADNGKEFACHEKIAQALESNFYFAQPYCSWQRGTHENTNGLVRQYAPKRTDFTQLAHQTISKIMNRLNSRPRKSLGYRTPQQVFQQVILKNL